MNNKMEIKKDNALKYWKEVFGDVQSAVDFSGRRMTRGQYGMSESKTGWNIDHRQPQSNGGTDHKSNLEIVNIITNNEKADKTSFMCNGNNFQVVKDNGKYSYKIVKLAFQDDELSDIEQLSDEQKLEYFNLFITGDTDFAGRIIDVNCTNPISDYSWGVALYNESKGLEDGNIYVANLITIDERDNKTSFEANGYAFKLRKINNQYSFVSSEKLDDITAFNNIIACTKDIFENEKIQFKHVMSLQLIPHDNYDSDSSIVNLTKFYNLVQNILKSINLSYAIKHDVEDVNYGFIIFDVTTKEDTILIYKISMIINGLTKYFIENEIFQSISSYGLLLDVDLETDVESYFNIYFNCFDNEELYGDNTIRFDERIYDILVEHGFNKNSFTEIKEDELYERTYTYTKLINAL